MSDLAIEKTMQVPLQPQHAFELFTERMTTWWPLASHSLSQSTEAKLSFPKAKGEQIVETAPDGTKHIWGELQESDPPHRLLFSFHPGQDAKTAPIVEVRFTADGDGTRVDLRHTGWEKLGDKAEETMSHYNNGWVGVLGAYESQAKS